MTIVLKPENVAQLVFFIRGEKVLLDADLAMLYDVEPRVLNQAVARNRKRFPADFVFQLSAREYDALTLQIVISDKDDARAASALRSQIVISKKGRGGEGTAICTAALLFTGTPVAREASRRSQTAATGSGAPRMKA